MSTSPDAYTAPFMLTKGMHRDVYPAIDPATNSALNASSKVVVVIGATSGLGFVSQYVLVSGLSIIVWLTRCEGYRKVLEQC